MRIFPFNLLRPFTSNDLDPIETGDYPHPPTEKQIEWVPEDGFPAGDEPLILAEGENPYFPPLPFFPDGGPGITEEVPS